jgi:ABC-type polysaccharide/polyol phosphate transport system ATPase subunit
MKKAIAIKADNLSKTYTLRNAIKDNFGVSTNELIALNNVSFQIETGDCVGIVGNNGSGKSTLLKILSGITKPTSGSVSLYGKVASILDIGAGFHPELTGKENVYLNAQLLGFSKYEVDQKFDEIIAFSEIGYFINEPVKNYSNGMYLRLAFSIMANLDFDIYLLDEVLSVGDDNFREKCQSKIYNLVQSKTKTFLIVSHVFQDLQYIATKYLSLDKGNLMKFENIDSFFERKHLKNNDVKAHDFYNYEKDLFESIKYKINNSATEIFDSDVKIILDFNIFHIKAPFNIGISIKDQFKNAVFETYFNQRINIGSTCNFQIELPNNFFNQGFYTIDFIVFENETILKFFKDVLHFGIKPCFFQNTIEKRSWGPTKPNVEIKFL